MMIVLIQVVLLILSFCTYSANSFRPSLQQHKHHQRRTTTSFTQQQSLTALNLSSRKDEIAKLEQQLRQLKLEQEKQESLRTTTEKDDEIAFQSSEVQRKLEKIKGKDMLLSEQELIAGGIVELENENQANGGGFGSIVTIAGAVLGLVLLIAFAQVPIGQDGLSQYSATGSSATAFKQIDLGDLNAEKPSD